MFFRPFPGLLPPVLTLAGALHAAFKLRPELLKGLEKTLLHGLHEHITPRADRSRSPRAFQACQNGIHQYYVTSCDKY